MKQGNILYVIVHESCVTEAARKNSISIKVEKELERIKTKEKHIFIEEPLEEVSNLMPKPSQDLEVKVCGAYYGGEFWCINRHQKALKKAGYKSKIHIPGSLIYNYNHYKRNCEEFI
ncbi:MAG: hypothetical protein WC781_00660 [Candidatus Pacearchaeota archaeon]|jgi:hypothetical protein